MVTLLANLYCGHACLQSEMQYARIITAIMGTVLCNISVAKSEHMPDKLKGNPAKVSNAGDVTKQQDAILVMEGKLMVRKDDKLPLGRCAAG